MIPVGIIRYCPVFFAALGGVGGLSRGQMSLAEVQCHLDKEGASDLVIDLIMNTTSDRVFQESILLAIALLEGGNTTIQVGRSICVYTHLAEVARILCTLLKAKVCSLVLKCYAINKAICLLNS